MIRPVRSAFLAIFLLSSCAGGGATVRRSAPAGAIEVRLCKAVDVRKDATGILSTEPVEVGDVFYAGDWQVVAWVSLGALARSHKVRWVWFDPTGERYFDSGDVAANPGGTARRFNQGWHALRVWGERASARAGRWNVTVYLDGQPAASRDFTLRVR
jgi:hypothetical protein